MKAQQLELSLLAPRGRSVLRMRKVFGPIPRVDFGVLLARKGIEASVTKGGGDESGAGVFAGWGVVDVPADEDVFEPDDEEVFAVEFVADLGFGPGEGSGAATFRGG